MKNRKKLTQEAEEALKNFELELKNIKADSSHLQERLSRYLLKEGLIIAASNLTIKILKRILFTSRSIAGRA